VIHVVYVVAKSGEYISLEFTNMVTECSYDFVFVFDGPTYDSPLLGSFSGETLPDVLVAASQYVSFIYHTVPRCAIVVVVIAQQLFSYCQLSRLRKSATMAGLSHKSCTVSCVGWLWQLNGCSTECGATPHSGQTSDMPLVMRAL